MDKTILESLTGKKGVKELPNDRESLFRGWLGNRMAIVLMAVQHVQARPERSMLRIEFFLFDLEHHFMNPKMDRRVRNAFRYLRHFFKAYPKINSWHSLRAMEMIGRIYEALGLVFDVTWSEKKSSVCVRERNEVRHGVKELFKFFGPRPVHC